MRYELVPDEMEESPRESCDNLGTMACVHRRYYLGDSYPKGKAWNMTVEDIQEIAGSKDYIALPLYLYDHSGITMSTSPFSCPWDSGQVGVIFVGLADVRKEYSVKHVTQRIREKVINTLVAEVKEYDSFITGDVYGFKILDDEDNEIDSCWGFIGYHHAEESAKEALACAEQSEREVAEMEYSAYAL